MNRHPLSAEVRWGLRSAVRNDSNAFSYSILATVSFGMVQLEVGSLTVVRLFLFVLGATGTFAIAEIAGSHRFRVRVQEEASDVVLLGTALGPFSVTVALAVGLAVAQVVAGALGWFLIPMVITTVYVALTGLQLTFARRHEQRHPPEDS